MAINAKPCVLVTRPNPQGEQLMQLLAEHQISAIHQPLFAYQGVNSAQTKLSATSPNSWLIFVSPAAVHYAAQLWPVTQWQYQQVFAVGEATQKALAELGITAISPQQQNSEGLLALPQLQQVCRQHIAIIRGESGRELLADTLIERGANVEYITVYQKQWLAISEQTQSSWQQLQVKIIVVTSQALLEYLLSQLNQKDKWWQQCHWLVASERIAEYAKQHLLDVVNLSSANNQAILTWLQEHYYDGNHTEN